MTDCENAEIRDLLPDYVHGTLSADALRRVEAHIADCGLCSEEWALLRRLGVALSAQAPVNIAAIVAALPPSPALHPRLVSATPRGTVPRRPLLQQRWLRMAASVAFVVGAGSLFVARTNREAVVTPSTVAVASPELATSVALDLSDVELRGLLEDIDALRAEPAENSEEVVRGLPGSTRTGDL